MSEGFFADGPSDIFPVGAIIGGDYQVIELLGKGASGSVYRVRHVMLDNEFALKVLNTEDLSLNNWHRFQNEAQMLAKIQHPNIVAAYNFGLHNNQVPFYVMDFIEGQSLAKRLTAGPLPLAQALPIFVQICSALSHAHQNGIIHRDIKPENLILLNVPPDSVPSVKLVDFGVAKSSQDKSLVQRLTGMGEVFGTPFYMSPEQCMGERIDARSDLYSLGCTLVEALSGKPPFRGRNAMETMLMHQNDKPPSLAKIVGPALDEVIQKTLAKAPMDRYRNIDLLGRDLKLISQGKDLAANPYSSASARVTNTGMAKFHAAPGESHPSRFKLAAVAIGIGLAIILLTTVIINKRDKLSAWLTPQTTPVAEEKNHYDGEISALQDIVPEVQAPTDSNNENKPYSHIETVRGERFRVFDFPSDITIGFIQSEKQDEDTKAVGRVSFPENDALIFMPAKCLEQYPNYVKRFQEGDIGTVRLREDQNSDRLLAVCATIPGVETLQMWNCWNLTSASAAALRAYPHLTLIDCGWSGLTGATIAASHNIANLEQLFIGGDKEVGPLLKVLPSCKKLERINLDNCRLNDSDFENLARVQSLKVVSLRQVPMSLNNLRALSRLPNLEALDLLGTGINKQAIPLLKTFPHLKTLMTRSIEGRILKKEMPRLKVE